jgi:two-component system response regulator FixJ
MPTERTVHVVDDDAGVRRSLDRLLQSAGFATVAYESGLAALDAAAQLTGGCLLVDARLPAVDGLETLARLHALGVRLPVVVMTGHGDVPTAVRAMKAGAVDFLEKPFDEEHLIATIEAALGRAGLGGRDREALEAAGRIAALSPRERKVLNALVAGRANKMIAYELGISVRTVEVHRARMLERLGSRRLAEAVRLAVMAGMAQVPDAGADGDQAPHTKRPSC